MKTLSIAQLATGNASQDFGSVMAMRIALMESTRIKIYAVYYS